MWALLYALLAASVGGGTHAGGLRLGRLPIKSAMINVFGPTELDCFTGGCSVVGLVVAGVDFAREGAVFSVATALASFAFCCSCGFTWLGAGTVAAAAFALSASLKQNWL